MKTLIILILFLSGLAGFAVSLYRHGSLHQSNDIQLTHSPVSFVQQIAHDRQAGEKIFKEFCASCHSKNPIIEVNAPRIGDKKVWRAKNQLGIKKLLKITTTGIAAMPARGGCFECSDQQLKETIQYILKESL